MSSKCCAFFLVFMVSNICYAFDKCQHSSSRAELSSVYQEAVLQNSELAAARAEFKAQQEAVPQARANLLPAISSNATFESIRLERDSPQLTRVRSGMTYQANLKQTLFNAELWFALKAAQASSAQSWIDLSVKEQDLVLRTAEVYFEVLRASDDLAATNVEEISFKKQMDQAQAKLKGGLSSITDVLDAQAAFDNVHANRKLAERKVYDGFEQLERLTNCDYSSIEGIEHQLPILPPAPRDAKLWVDAAVRQNLTLLASERAVEVAAETFNQRRSAYVPTLEAVASYRKGDNDSFGYSNPTDFGTGGYQGNVAQSSIALQVNLPIYTGGRMTSQARESYQRLIQNEELNETQRRDVVFNTRNYYRAVNSDIEQISARKKYILSSQASLKASKVGADIGTRNTVDVLNAQRQLFKAVRDYNNARYDYVLNNLRLKKVAGSLGAEDLYSLARYLKRDYEPRRDFLPSELGGADFH